MHAEEREEQSKVSKKSHSLINKVQILRLLTTITWTEGFTDGSFKVLSTAHDVISDGIGRIDFTKSWISRLSLNNNQLMLMVWVADFPGEEFIFVTVWKL